MERERVIELGRKGKSKKKRGRRQREKKGGNERVPDKWESEREGRERR